MLIKRYQVGVDVFGAVIAALDTTIALFTSIYDALQNAKELPIVLQTYKTELLVSEAIVKKAQSAPALQSRAIKRAVQHVGARVKALNEHLKSLDQGRGRAREIAHQLLRGQRDRDLLKNLVSDLSRSKDDLTTLISVTDSEFLRGLKDQMDQVIHGQSITSSASLDTVEATMVGPASSRVVRYNEASDSSFMLNAPVLKRDASLDPWENIAHVCVENNKTRGKSTMINHAATQASLEDLFELLLRKERVSAEVEQSAKGRGLSGIEEGQ